MDQEERKRWKGLEDAETFCRVWSRVAGADSPILPGGGTWSGDPPKAPPAMAEAKPGESGAPGEKSGPPPPGAGGTSGTDAPEPGRCGLCFSGGNQESRALQALVLEMAADAADYAALARLAGREGQLLLALEREKLRQGKRLAAAYFLMTGVRYWPRGNTPAPAATGLLPGLRQRFLAEGRLGRTLRGLAENADDRCLRELYATLAEETERMMEKLRRLVEREIPR